MKNVPLILVIFLWLFAFIGAAESPSAETKTLDGPYNQTNLISKEDDEIINTCKWGSSTNGVRMGIALIRDTQFEILNYLLATNSTGVSGPAPAPHGYRLGLSLQDATGKPVARTKAGDALCQEVGWTMRRTMKINRWTGFYLLPPNIPRRYDSTFNVLACFNVQKPGVYDLQVKGTLYIRTAPPPSAVTPMEIPASSLRLVITQADLDAYAKRVSILQE